MYSNSISSSGDSFKGIYFVEGIIRVLPKQFKADHMSIYLRFKP